MSYLCVTGGCASPVRNKWFINHLWHTYRDSWDVITCWYLHPAGIHPLPFFACVRLCSATSGTLKQWENGLNIVAFHPHETQEQSLKAAEIRPLAHQCSHCQSMKFQWHRRPPQVAVLLEGNNWAPWKIIMDSKKMHKMAMSEKKSYSQINFLRTEIALNRCLRAGWRACAQDGSKSPTENAGQRNIEGSSKSWWGNLPIHLRLWYDGLPEKHLIDRVVAISSSLLTKNHGFWRLANCNDWGFQAIT